MSVDKLAKAFEESLSLKDSSVKSEDIQKLNDIQAAEEHQWIVLSSRFPAEIGQLNETLKTRTYLLDTPEPSYADAVVAGKVIPLAKKWTEKEIVELRHVIRWLDLIQNVLNIKEKLEINVDQEAPREIKEKKKKEGDAKKGGAGADAATKDKKQESKAKEATKEAKADNKNVPKGAPKTPEELEALKQAKKEKKEKSKKEKKPQPAKKEVVITPGMVDLRVGFIEKAIKHPDADSLYVSTIQMGDADGPRTVCSGLVKHFPLEAMQERYVVVVANLKPVTMRGIKSCAMVLCASNESTVEFVNPPEGSKAGDKIFFETYDIEPEAVLNPKKKIWEAVQPGFSTNSDLEVIFKKDGEPDRKLVNKKGELCHVKSLVNAEVR